MPKRNQLVAIRTDDGIRLEQTRNLPPFLRGMSSIDPHREVVYIWRDQQGKRAVER